MPSVELDASLDWLSLSMTPGLGSRLTGKLLRQFGSPRDIFRASLTEAPRRAICPLCARAGNPVQMIAQQGRRRRNSRRFAQSGLPLC